MCEFKSGIIFKNRVVLAPICDESHSRLLDSLGIEDTEFNASRVFVRAELVPYENDMTSDIDKWTFKVDQDILPNWFEEDVARYEDEFREEVRNWYRENIYVICGVPCTKVLDDGENEWYHTCISLFKSTQYEIKDNLETCEFAKSLSEEYKDRLQEISFDLISTDGFNCGKTRPSILVIPTLDFYRDNRKRFFMNGWWWLSTPWNTGRDLQDVVSSSYFAVVSTSGIANYPNASYALGVRPLFALRKDI